MKLLGELFDIFFLFLNPIKARIEYKEAREIHTWKGHVKEEKWKKRLSTNGGKGHNKTLRRDKNIHLCQSPGK